METVQDESESVEVAQIDQQIDVESDPATVVELQQRRALVRRERESERANPELSAIMHSSATRAVSSVFTPLPPGSARLSGPVTPEQLASMQAANRKERELVLYVERRSLFASLCATDSVSIVLDGFFFFFSRARQNGVDGSS